MTEIQAKYGRFYSVDEVLDYAYQAEVMRISPDASYELLSRGTNPNDLSREDRIADGLMIKNMAMRSLDNLYDRHVVAAWYRKPYDDSLQDMVNYSMVILLGYIQMHKKQRMDRFFVLDQIREWSPHSRAHHDLTWWSDHLGVPLGTLKKWAIIRDPARKSINYLLDDLLNCARAKLEPALAEKGLI